MNDWAKTSESTPRAASSGRRILRRAEVTMRTGLSNTTIHRESQAGRFPRPVPLGQRAVGWLEHEVDAWLDARASGRNG